MTQQIKVINFYKFFQLEHPEQFCQQLYDDLKDIPVRGTLILAPEGLNGSLAAMPHDVEQAFQKLCSYPELTQLSYRESFARSQPYKKLLVRTKAQILTFPKEADPSIADIQATPALSPEQWQAKIETADDKLVILDTRNQYEVEAGSFAGAKDLGIERFQEFPEEFLKQYGEQKDKTFLMFCTGGIRCEKAVAFARKQGFPHVYKLDGGIINYLKEQGPKLWQGECFVFDQRWTIGADRNQGTSFSTQSME